MTKTIKIEGMMCGHCEATVKKALEALSQVDSAEVSHTAVTAVVTLNADVSDDVLKKTVEDRDYKVTASNRSCLYIGFSKKRWDRKPVPLFFAYLFSTSSNRIASHSHAWHLRILCSSSMVFLLHSSFHTMPGRS